ncbi:hypothetical protein FXO37_24235 [Capsicum annuum]|nr:hypothetical protein FXO37_24235 [Capsicum annuum]
MGISTREEGFLKLVHPGRRVETHTEPVIAAENSNLKEKRFLKNHGKHSLNQWSSLVEGRQFMSNHGKLNFTHRNSPLRSITGMTTKHLRHRKHPSRLQNSPWYDASYEEDDFKENRNGHDNFSQQSKRYNYSSNSYSTSRVVSYHRRYTIRPNQNELKSCLRKLDSARGRLNLRVTFGMPTVTKL